MCHLYMNSGGCSIQTEKGSLIRNEKLPNWLLSCTSFVYSCKTYVHIATNMNNCVIIRSQYHISQDYIDLIFQLKEGRKVIFHFVQFVTRSINCHLLGHSGKLLLGRKKKKRFWILPKSSRNVLFSFCFVTKSYLPSTRKHVQNAPELKEWQKQTITMFIFTMLK